MEVVKKIADRKSIFLIIIPGDDRTDPELIGHSTIPLVAVNRLWRYFTEGGIENAAKAAFWDAPLPSSLKL